MIYKDSEGTTGEGRIITAIFEDFVYILSYTPTLGCDAQGNIIKQERRQSYDVNLSNHIKWLKQKYNLPIMLNGDLNVVINYTHIWDTKKLDSNQPSATKEERERILEIISKNKWKVAYDNFDHNELQPYTFFLGKNQGMKIDHFLVPEEWLNNQHSDIKVTNCDILRGQLGSDHLPVVMTAEFSDNCRFRQVPKRSSMSNIERTAYFSKFEQSPKQNKIRNTDPLMYRGVPLRSPMTNILTSVEDFDTIARDILET